MTLVTMDTTTTDTTATTVLEETSVTKSDAAPMSGLRKAAIVLLNMDKKVGGEVLRHLGETRSEILMAEVTQLGGVDAAATARALTEYKKIINGGTVPSRGGQDVATALLETAFGREKAVGMVGRVMGQGSVSFDFLNAADPAQLAAILEGELAATVAVVLSHLRADRAAAALAALPETLRLDVAEAISNMGTATQEAIAIVADSLRSRIGVFAVREANESVGGVQSLVEIINRSDATMEKSLLASIEERDAELAENIRSRMVTFADIVRLDGRDIQRVLRGLDLRTLALALKGADEPIVEAINRNMTENNRVNLDEERRLLGPVKVRQSDEARSDVVRVIRTLASEGEITITRDDDDELVD